MAKSNLNILSKTPDNLCSDEIKCMPVLVNAGEYRRGEVLGRIANAYGKLSTPDAIAAAVMPFDLTVSFPTTLTVYVAGEFNEGVLYLDGQDLETVKTALRDRGIFAKKWGVAPDVA